MDQYRKVPKILTSVKEIQNPQTYGSQISQLKKQMSHFMKDMKKQFSTMVNSYQKQLSSLKLESDILKRSQSITRDSKSSRNAGSGVYINIDDQFIGSTGLLPLRSNEFSRTASSQFYRTQKRQSKQFPSWGSTIETRTISPFRVQQAREVQFPEQLIHQQFQSPRNSNKSRYERHSQRKRHNQQQIVHCLQSHKKNLDLTTVRMMNLIGKGGKDASESAESLQSQVQSISGQRQMEDHHNQSLSQVCTSLDKSFVSQRARKSKMKKKRAEEQAKRKQQEQEIKNEKIRKQKALKTLLQRLRQNANSTSPPEIVKASKLISTGTKISINSKTLNQQQPYPIRKNSKVMINPVPVNLSKTRQQSPSFIQKRPTSILKQNSNILTRSISGISAISFEI